MCVWLIRPDQLGIYFYSDIRSADVFDKTAVSLGITTCDFHSLADQRVDMIFLGEGWSLCAGNLHVPHINLNLIFTYVNPVGEDTQSHTSFPV